MRGEHSNAGCRFGILGLVLLAGLSCTQNQQLGGDNPNQDAGIDVVVADGPNDASMEALDAAGDDTWRNDAADASGEDAPLVDASIDSPLIDQATPDSGCATGTRVCVDNAIEECADGGSWTLVRQCPATASCDQGVCVGSSAKLAAGTWHTCAITAAGSAKCWGSNIDDQIGNGSSSQLACSAQQVLGLDTGVVSVAVGGAHSCAANNAGDVVCWGDNKHMQLGGAQASDTPIPVAGAGGTEAVRGLSGGTYHTCAITQSRRVRCWGGNDYGQLGNGMHGQDAAPDAVVGLGEGIRSMCAGGFHSCAVDAAGSVFCWGSNDNGQLGVSGMSMSSDPTQAGVTEPVTSVSCGWRHSCVVTDSGGALCWGANDQAQLGDNGTDPSSSPVQPQGLTSGVDAVVAGDTATCALLAGGSVKCWGVSGAWTSLIPFAVPGLQADVTAMGVGGDHACALFADGSARCLGSNHDCLLGIAYEQPQSHTPVEVVGF